MTGTAGFFRIFTTATAGGLRGGHPTAIANAAMPDAPDSRRGCDTPPEGTGKRIHTLLTVQARVVSPRNRMQQYRRVAQHRGTASRTQRRVVRGSGKSLLAVEERKRISRWCNCRCKSVVGLDRPSCR